MVVHTVIYCKTFTYTDTVDEEFRVESFWLLGDGADNAKQSSLEFT